MKQSEAVQTIDSNRQEDVIDAVAATGLLAGYING